MRSARETREWVLLISLSTLPPNKKKCISEKRNAVKHEGTRQEKETETVCIITRCAFCGSGSPMAMMPVMIRLNRCVIYINRNEHLASVVERKKNFDIPKLNYIKKNLF